MSTDTPLTKDQLLAVVTSLCPDRDAVWCLNMVANLRWFKADLDQLIWQMAQVSPIADPAAVELAVRLTLNML